MTAQVRRKVWGSSMPMRRLLSDDALHMMVHSGVVRRVDSSPPKMSLPQFYGVEHRDQIPSQDLAAEPGWLSRIALGQRSPALFFKRSQIR